MSRIRSHLFNRIRFAAFGAPRRPRHPFLRIALGLVGVALLLALLFVSVFVGIAMLAIGMFYRLWKHRRSPLAARAATSTATPSMARSAWSARRNFPSRTDMGSPAHGDLVAVAPTPRIPVRDRAGNTLGHFPVRRIYCVGRNFADHAREMGAIAPASKAERGTPVFFMKPADAIVVTGEVPYPPGTRDLHHEVELVVALGTDAPAGELPVDATTSLVFAYGVGLDLTRRDLQSAAKAKGLPWDTGKGFDHSAPVSTLLRASDVGDLATLSISLDVNGERRQQSGLDQLIWNVPEILHELSKLYALRAGDLVFMGTPAGVAALQPGDRFHARLGDIAELQGLILPAAV